MQLLRAGGVQPLAAALREGLDERGDGPRLLRVVVVIVVVHLQKGPLGPVVVGRVAGAHLTVPVERKADLVQLLAVAGDVLRRRHGRMLSGLDGVLLGRKSEGVVAHRMQDVESARPLVAGVDVRCDVAQRVTDVQTRPRGVGEHVENVEFRTRGIRLHAVGAPLLPALLPFGLQLLEIIFHKMSKFANFHKGREKYPFVGHFFSHVSFRRPLRLRRAGPMPGHRRPGRGDAGLAIGCFVAR